MATILYGKTARQQIENDVTKRVETLRAQGVVPKLAIVRVGDNSDDLAYQNGIMKRAEAVGVEIDCVELPVTIDQHQIEQAIRDINENPDTHGCLMMRPLPRHLDERAVCELLDPSKDIDGITRGSLADVFIGNGTGFPPCTADACVRMLDAYNIPIEGRHAVVVGRSLVIGRPVASLLLARNATVTICHSKTVDLASIVSQADIVVCATGRARFYGADLFRAGQTVLDVGINFDESGTMCGDVAFDEVEAIVDAITPVPRGIGTITSSIAIEHVVSSAEQTR